jgi:hypothetical protein
MDAPAQPKVITRIQGQKYANNPRQITRKQFERLRADLAELGDLSGVVHDLNSNQFIGGNQRSEAFSINNCEIELVEQYAQPDAQGTVAHGFVVWQGGRYAYRQVRWTEQQCRAANIKANIDGGSWDADIIASWPVDELQAYGWDVETLKGWQGDATALSSFIESNKSIEFPEYDETIADGIKVCQCPLCGNEHAAKK